MTGTSSASGFLPFGNPGPPRLLFELSSWRDGLTKLNAIAIDILALLYEDTRHMNGITAGILRFLFSDDEDRLNDGSPPVLDKSLGVAFSLAYGKRSGGECKRIDLVLFFAMLQSTHTNSPHRARYMLVNKVFNSFDLRGLKGVIRWCDALASRVSFVLALTHNEQLARFEVA
jgi:hypothetical protein